MTLPEGTPVSHRHALRIYGLSCIFGQAMVLGKGLTLKDPFLIASGGAGMIGQVANAIWNHKAKPYTPPALILSAALALASGISALVHSGVAASAIEHVAFGGVKAAGLAMLFYGCRAPVLRMAGIGRPELLGEAMLGIATSALALDGIQQFAGGWAGHDKTRLLNGALTLAAAAGFFVGQRYASITQKHQRLGLARAADGLAPHECGS